MRVFKTFFLTLTLSIFSIIGYSQQTKATVHKVETLEVVQVNSYTYLRVKDNNKENWLAAPSFAAKVGETYYYKGGMEMSDFESKELDRTFKSVIFLSTISKNPTGEDNTSFKHAKSKSTKQHMDNDNASINIKPAEGGISISELYKNKELYKGKRIKIRGKVMKYNSQVMSKNWIHIEDGTDYNGEFDVTITSNAEVSVGDIITVEGLVSLDKDFGYGYFYKLIIENAILIK